VLSAAREGINLLSNLIDVVAGCRLEGTIMGPQGDGIANSSDASSIDLEL